KTLLDEDVAINYSSDVDDLLYCKIDDESTAEISLYHADFGKPGELIANNVSLLSLYVYDNSYVFAVKTGSVSCYDYVIDDTADADKNLKEPKLDDYEIPYYSYDIISADDAKESDYTELYTSCTKPLYWFGASTWCYSMEEALGMIWNGDEESTKSIVKATQDFIDKYSSKADENGYILVTDEIKEELKKIDKASGNNGDFWIYLCLSRTQQGTTYDYDAYNAEYEKYNEAKTRIELRDTLKSPAYDHGIFSWYRYKDGHAELIAENVLSYSLNYSSNVIEYNTPEMITEKIKLDDISYPYEVEEFLSVDQTKENYIIPVNEKYAPSKLTTEAAQIIGEVSSSGSDRAGIIVSDGYIFINDMNNHKLYAASYSNDGHIGTFQIVSDKAAVLSNDNDQLYYYTRDSFDDNYGKADIYKYSGGTGTCIASDVLFDGVVNFYEDGMIIARTGFGTDGYDIAMFDQQGNQTYIGDNATEYIRVDKDTVLFIANNNLYKSSNNNSVLIETGVQSFWSMNSMTLTESANGYY
ncbi:MAG: hypothetical protein IJM53_03315, partial [Lachnospiraceae bacterium]|nr:hypothetical protein [Lachnospiraceae bacterium]